MMAILQFIFYPIKAYRAFCASCDAIEETTRQIEQEGKFEGI